MHKYTVYSVQHKYTVQCTVYMSKLYTSILYSVQYICLSCARVHCNEHSKLSRVGWFPAVVSPSIMTNVGRMHVPSSSRVPMFSVSWIHDYAVLAYTWIPPRVKCLLRLDHTWVLWCKLWTYWNSSEPWTSIKFATNIFNLIKLNWFMMKCKIFLFVLYSGLMM